MARVPKIKTASAGAPEDAVKILQDIPKRNWLLPFFFVVSILFLIAAGIAGYFYYQYRQSLVPKDAKEIAELTSIIGQVMELPQDETPTLATVTDKEKLNSQPFFQKAENNDKVLIYSQSGKAILYRPSTKKIIDVTTVNVNSQKEKEVVSPAPSQLEVKAPVKVALLNGSTKIGVTSSLEDALSQSVSDITIVAKEKAVKTDYSKTLVVDISGNNTSLAEKIASLVKGEIGSLPSEETVPAGAEILVIVGQEK